MGALSAQKLGPLEPERTPPEIHYTIIIITGQKQRIFTYEFQNVYFPKSI